MQASHYVPNWTVEVLLPPLPFAVAASESEPSGQGDRVRSLPSAEVAESLGRKGQSSGSWRAKDRSAGSSSSLPSSCLMWMARNLPRIHCPSPTHSLVHHIRTLHRCCPHIMTSVQAETSLYSRSMANPTWTLVPTLLRRPALLVERQRVDRPVWRPSWHADALPAAASLCSEVAGAFGWAVPSRGYPSSSACSVEVIPSPSPFPSDPFPLIPSPSSGSLHSSGGSYPSRDLRCRLVECSRS